MPFFFKPQLSLAAIPRSFRQRETNSRKSGMRAGESYLIVMYDAIARRKGWVCLDSSLCSTATYLFVRFFFGDNSNFTKISNLLLTGVVQSSPFGTLCFWAVSHSPPVSVCVACFLLSSSNNIVVKLCGTNDFSSHILYLHTWLFPWCWNTVTSLSVVLILNPLTLPHT